MMTSLAFAIILATRAQPPPAPVCKSGLLEDCESYKQCIADVECYSLCVPLSMSSAVSANVSVFTLLFALTRAAHPTPPPPRDPLSAARFFIRRSYLPSDGTSTVSGTIPPELMALPKLSYVSLGENKISGTLPQTLPHTMHQLSVSFNYISGTIPESYCLLPALAYLTLDGNSIAGTIPECIGELGASMDTFSIGVTNVEGTIPASISKFKHIRFLDLSRNQMSGTIPDAFYKMTVRRALVLCALNCMYD